MTVPVHRSPRSNSIPRVLVDFLTNENMQLSLIFDTGSNHFHVEKMVGKFVKHGAYSQYVDRERDSGIKTDVCLLYGAGGSICMVSVENTVTERIRIGPVEFQATVGLTSSNQNIQIGAGILGAGPDSAWTRKVSVFGYIAGKMGQNGRILVGYHDWSTYCLGRKSPQFQPTAHEKMKWMLSGSVKVGSGMSEVVDWEIDTGTNHVVLDKIAYDSFVKELARSGAKMVQSSPVGLSVTNCLSYASWPPVILRIGLNSNSVTVKLNPGKYLSAVTQDTCVLQIARGGSYGIIGTSILDQFLTVFDSHKRRIGFCSI